MSIKEMDPEIYQDLLKRMKRIEGQARGVQRLLQEGADCDAIVIQLAAMRAALNQVGIKAAACQLNRRMAEEMEGGGDGRDALNEMMRTFLRLG